MSNLSKDYMTIQQAAVEIGVQPSTLASRIRKGKILAEKIGWNKFIHINEVKRAKKVEEKKRADNKTLENASR